MVYTYNRGYPKRQTPRKAGAQSYGSKSKDCRATEVTFKRSFTHSPESHGCKPVDEWLLAKGSALGNLARKDATAVLRDRLRMVRMMVSEVEPLSRGASLLTRRAAFRISGSVFILKNISLKNNC